MSSETRLEHNRFNRAVLTLCLAMVFGLLFFVQAVNGLFSDDLHYATFWNGNVYEFFGKVAEHYKTYNGRVLVHLFPQVLLAYPMWVHALFMTVVLVFTGIINMRWQFGHAASGTSAAGALLFGAQILLIGINTLREGLLWSSAAYNYVLPAAFYLTACFCWDKWLNDGKRKSLIWLLPMQFLCAATTEQCGAMTIAGTALVGIIWLIRNKSRIHKRGVVFLAPLANVAGYITLFLSPATGERMSARMHFDSEFFSNTIPEWASYYMAQKAVLPIFIAFCLLITVFAWRQRARLWPLLAGIPMGAVLIWSSIANVSENHLAIIFVIFLVYILIAALLLCCFTELRQGAILLLIGLVGALIMLPTGTHGFRTTIPFVISIVLVNTLLIIDLLARLSKTKQNEKLISVILLCITLICSLQFIPTAGGYWRNHLKDKENAESIENAKETGILEYNIDYDPLYGYNRVFSDGYSQKALLKLHGLEDCTIYFISDILAGIYVGESRMTSPVMLNDGIECFPVAQIIRALGGTVDWSPERTVFILEELTVTEAGDTLYCETPDASWTVSLSGESSVINNYKYFSAELMEQAFGLTFRKEDGAYRLAVD